MLYPATGSGELVGASQVKSTEYETAAVPVPVRPMTAVPLVEELLMIVSCPVAAPAVDGSNCTFSVAICPVVNVAGNVGPDSVKPVPVTVAELTVTDPVPVLVKVTVCVDSVFNVTLPNPTLVALMLSVDVPWVTVKVTAAVAVV